MSVKTNNEKLQILQERLAHIKGKQENEAAQSRKEKVSDLTTPKINIPVTNKKPLYSSWLSKYIFIGAIAYGLFYAYKNIDVDSISPKSNPSEETQEPTNSKIIEYKLNLEGNNIALINSFEDENAAKVMVNDLSIKGFKCNYFFFNVVV